MTDGGKDRETEGGGHCKGSQSSQTSLLSSQPGTAAGNWYSPTLESAPFMKCCLQTWPGSPDAVTATQGHPASRSVSRGSQHLPVLCSHLGNQGRCPGRGASSTGPCRMHRSSWGKSGNGKEWESWWWGARVSLPCSAGSAAVGPSRTGCLRRGCRSRAWIYHRCASAPLMRRVPRWRFPGCPHPRAQTPRALPGRTDWADKAKRGGGGED